MFFWRLASHFENSGDTAGNLDLRLPTPLAGIYDDTFNQLTENLTGSGTFNRTVPKYGLKISNSPPI